MGRGSTPAGVPGKPLSRGGQRSGAAEPRGVLLRPLPDNGEVRAPTASRRWGHNSTPAELWPRSGAHAPTGPAGSGDVEAVQIHHLGPGGDEVPDELLL